MVYFSLGFIIRNFMYVFKDDYILFDCICIYIHICMCKNIIVKMCIVRRSWAEYNILSPFWLNAKIGHI